MTERAELPPLRFPPHPLAIAYGHLREIRRILMIHNVGEANDTDVALMASVYVACRNNPRLRDAVADVLRLPLGGTVVERQGYGGLGEHS